VLAGYGAERTRWDHQNAIKQAYGYTDLKGDAWSAMLGCRLS
jgi:hypothetical protein